MDNDVRRESEAGATTGALSRRALLGAGAVGAAGMAFAACGSGGKSAETAAGASSSGSESGGTFYWISHGAPADQIWVIAQSGARQVGKDLGVKVNTSLHRNDLAAQQEAINAAIAAGADGIATSSPQPKTLNRLVAKAKKAGIPVVMMNTDDADAGRLAYVGPDLVTAGTIYARKLVDDKLVKPGDTVFAPVEVAGATYGVLETKGIKSVFEPLGIKLDVFEAGQDPAQSISNMQGYLSRKGKGVAAMIGLGDQVTANVKKVWEGLGWSPGKIPVVGWGNTKDSALEVKEGYVNAALWQYPDSQGYLPIALLKMLADGLAIGYDIPTLKAYDKSTVDEYMKYFK